MDTSLGDILRSGSLHFTLSFLAGVLAWVSASYVLKVLDYDLANRKYPVDFVTRFVLKYRNFFLLVLAIAVALIAHILEDFYFNYF